MKKEAKLQKKKDYLQHVLGAQAYEQYEKSKKQKSEPLSISRPDRSTAFMSGLDAYSGPWTQNEIAHLLRRTMFGVTKNDLKALESLNASMSVDILLSQGDAPSPPVNDYNDATITDPQVGPGDTWINADYDGNYEGARINSLKIWMISNIINQGFSLEEKMLLFWHNHLVTEFWGVFVAKTSYRYIEKLRENVFGNLKELVKAITLETAMLYYLNGAANNKDAPDENYGRELQELFCIGKGPNSNYTEGDVQAAARLLTGWTVDWNTQTTVWNQWIHDTDDKQFSSFYGNTLIQGKSGDAGQGELDELIDMIFDNNEVALFICRKLYTFFVYAEIDDETEMQIIEPLAQIFRDNNYEIKPVLETLLKSEHFFDIANQGAIIKNPADALLGAWRSFQGEFPEGASLNDLYLMKVGMMWSMANIGMEIGDPPSVAGWPAYYQMPVYDKIWINTTTITRRAIQTDSLIHWGFWTPGTLLNIDVIKFVESLDNPEDPNLLLEETSRLLLGLEMGDTTIAQLKAILLSGQATDYYWTSAWLDYVGDPSNEEYKMIVENRLKWTLQRILQLAEFQLS